MFTLPTLLWVVACSACGAPSFTATKVDGGSLYQKGDVWVMELSGTPQTRGHAAGILLGEQIRWALPRYLESTMRSSKPPARALALVQQLEPHIPKPYLEELDAMAQAAKIDRDYLLMVNLAPELWAGMACSSVAVTDAKSASKTPLLARNLDWYGGDVLTELGLVIVHKNASHDVASLGYPGMVGMVTAMNDTGFSMANLVVLGQQATPVPGIPVLFALRQIMESAQDVAGATEKLKAIARTVPQNYAMADRQHAAVLETWTRRFKKRDTKAGVVAIANHFDEEDNPIGGGRYGQMMALQKSPQVGVSELKAMLRQVALGAMNVHAVIFDPAKRVLHGSTRSRPAADGPYWELNLGEVFGVGKD